MTTTRGTRFASTVARLAALTLANAFIFQAELAESNSKVRPLRKMLAEVDLVTAFSDHWKFICDSINYVPIFDVARQVLLLSPSRKDTNDALRELGKQVLPIIARRAALRHDLMGRIYHRLLLEAKSLGTFYTSVPAATLLMKLAIDPRRWSTDFGDLDDVRKIRVADLACGTGTLLMAAQQTITDNHIRAVIASGRRMDADMMRDLHKATMEEVLHGYDVLASAVHLTASTLALLAPEIGFRDMSLHCLELGVVHGKIRLGSIDFLSGPAVSELRLWPDDRGHRGNGDRS